MSPQIENGYPCQDPVTAPEPDMTLFDDESSEWLPCQDPVSAAEAAVVIAVNRAKFVAAPWCSVCTPEFPNSSQHMSWLK